MPPLQMFWFLPTAGDGHYLATSRGARAVDLNYLREIAHAADYRGFDGCLLPTGRGYEDTWVTAAAVIPDTRRIKLLVAVRPGLMSPTLSARMAATFDRLSNGRLLVNVVCSGDPVENHGDGLFLDHDARYAAADEFLDIWKRLCHGETVTMEGTHLAVKEASLTLPVVQRPHPPLYLGGSSEAALRGGGEAHRLLPDLGRTAGDGGGEGGADAGAGGGAGADDRLRHPAARDRPRDRGRRVGRRGQADPVRGRGGRQQGPRGVGPAGLGGPGADGAVAERRAGRARRPPEPVGGRGAGAGRGWHGVGRQPPSRWPGWCGSTPTWGSTRSS